jgi:flagellar biosynthesis/type III secretory pathway protein FliH
MAPRGTRLQDRLNRIVRASSIEVSAPAPPANVETAVTDCDTPHSGASLPAVDSAEQEALRALLAALAQLVEEFRGRRRQTAVEIAQTSVELAVALAERLVNTEITANRQRLDRIVRQALMRLPSARAIAVRAHPDDIALLEKQRVENDTWTTNQDVLTFRPDLGCARGQLTIDSGDFFVEWDTARCLAELRKVLLEETFTEA